ncbi:fructose-bisphosphatase class II [Candidatus Microgenomates bacterium]|nr:fructose-bisphosphatase class II [Candidatus Microgenomates bacterium]
MTGEGRTNNPDLSRYALIRPDIELFPEREIVLPHMLRVIGWTAISAHRLIEEFTGGRPEDGDLSKEEKDRRVIRIDTEADRVFRWGLGRVPFQSHVIAGEGAKEAAADHLGTAMPVTLGMVGTGGQRLDLVHDVVEGTTNAAHNRPNAVSIIGVSTHGGIVRIPTNPRTGREANYVCKLFAPKEFRDALSLEIPTRYNLRAMMKHAGIEAGAITVAVMDRKCNATIIREAEEFGAKVERISSGDLLQGLKAMLSEPEHPIIMLGRGGAPEGVITAVAARALDATGQLRVIEEERDMEAEYTTRIWTPEMSVPGAPEQSSVMFTAITRNDHFNLPAVRPTGQPNHYEVVSLVIDPTGVHQLTTVLDYPECL